jgi:hypothetical protein
MGKRRLQAPPRRLPHSAQLLDLPRNVMGWQRANEPPRWSWTPPPWYQSPPFPLVCRCWLLTLLAQWSRTQGVPNWWCLQARCALLTSNPLLPGQGAETRWSMWRRAHLPCSPCRTPIFRRWGAQVLSHVTVGRRMSGQRLGPSMRQQHCRGVGVVVVLSV